jgi:hypothetical protein
MKSNRKIILSAVGVAMLLVSPAMAKSHAWRHHHSATMHVLKGAYGSAAEPNYSGREAPRPYNWDRDHDPRDNPQE